MNSWPTEEAINATGLNGEPDAPTYKIGLTIYRINPAGNYALYWNGRKWSESQSMTNAAVRLNGTLQK